MNRVSAIPLALFALAACTGDSTGAGANTARLSFTTSRQGASPQVNASPLARSITVTGGGSTLVINRAQLVLEELELKTIETASCDNSGPGRDPSCHELDIGPILVDLPLDDAVRTELSVTIPSGTYREIEFELDAADDDDGPEAAFIAANPAFRRISVRIEGTINGQPFVFTSGVEAEMELELNPPLVIGTEGGNVTVFVDVGAWFTTSTGGVIDPLAAQLNDGFRATVESNIRASFAAFDDDDRDGRRDDS